MTRIPTVDFAAEYITSDNKEKYIKRHIVKSYIGYADMEE